MKTLDTRKARGLTASTYDFRESNKVDPTHGWIPFVVVIASMPILLALMVLAGYLILG